MSNGVGKLYEMIIDGVIHEAQADFENLGVSQQTLQLLKNEWQKRLSAMNVTSYLPWDVNDRWSSVPQQPVYYNSYDLGMPSGVPSGMSSGMPSMTGGMPTMSGGMASGMPSMPTLSTPTAPAAQPGSAGAALKQEDYSQYSHAPQTDGAPAQVPRAPRAPGAAEATDAAQQPPLPVSQADLLDVIAEKMAEIEQADGAGEEVGSDLDDSEDDLNSEEEEGDNGMVMLCLYEKVQRVKNKWKFTFKDGVATINGSDYVFSRGTGEAEW